MADDRSRLTPDSDDDSRAGDAARESSSSSEEQDTVFTPGSAVNPPIMDHRAPREVLRPTGGPLPESVGQFRVQRLVASGGMGTVYEAKQDHPSRVVALKVMKRSIASETARKRFELESQLLAEMHHPGIAQVYESGEFGDAQPFYAMEFIPGALPLTEYADRAGLSIPARLQLFLQVCRAVMHVHRNAIIHRDLKPDNILVGTNGQPKIIDFGIARATNTDRAFTTEHPDAKKIIGALQYMAPEQIDPEPYDIDARCDVYALGVILYQLLCGELPYRVPKDNIVGAARIIREEPPRTPSRISRQVTGDLQLIVLKALQKRRDDRYQSADALAEDIDQYLKGEPLTHGRQPTLTYLAWVKLRSAIQSRSTMIRAAVLALAFLIAYWPAHRLVYSSNLHSYYYNWLTTNFSTDQDKAFKNTRVIRMSEASFDAVEQLADRYGFTDVFASDRGSLRRLRGELLKRVAESGARPRAWVYDLKFTQNRPQNTELVEGLQKMQAAGIPVIICAPRWIEPSGQPEVASELRALVHWGGMTLNIPQHGGAWSVDVFAGRGFRQPTPGISLQAVAQAQTQVHGFDAVYDLDHRGYSLAITGKKTTGGYEPVWMDPSEERRLHISKIELFAGEDGNDLGLREDDWIGKWIIENPGLAGREASTYEWHEMFDWTDQEMRDNLDDRFIVVGDFTGTDIFEYHGEMVHGAYGHAAAVESLANGSSIREEPYALTQIMLGAAALIGMLIAVLGRSVPQRVAAFLGASVLLIIISVLLYVYARVIYDPLPTFVALATALVLMVLVLRVQAQYEAS